MRENCARVLAAALMTGAIGFVLAMPALFGTAHDAVRSLTAPPSSLQGTVHVVASALSGPAHAGRVEHAHSTRPALRTASPVSGRLASSVRRPSSAPRPAPKPAPRPAPRPAPQPAPQPTPQPTPQPAPQPAPATDTRTLANETPAAPVVQPAPTVLAPDPAVDKGKKKNKDKRDKDKRDKEKAKPPKTEQQPAQAPAPPKQCPNSDDGKDHQDSNGGNGNNGSDGHDDHGHEQGGGDHKGNGDKDKGRDG